MSTDCVPYIQDLKLEIEILKNVKNMTHKKETIKLLDKKIKEKEQMILKCREILKKLSNNQICYRIYLNMLSGLSINKSIAKVANENYLNNIKPASERAIYKRYYAKLKKILKNQ